jgi:hypothetical protein
MRLKVLAFAFAVAALLAFGAEAARADVVPGVAYQVSLAGKGWTDWIADGNDAGDGKYPIDAVKIKLTGELKRYYSVEYMVEQEKKGWTDWTAEGQVCGTPGQKLHIKSIKIKLVHKADGGPAGNIVYRAHFEKKGRSDWVSGGDTLTNGVTRLEILQVRFEN